MWKFSSKHLHFCNFESSTNWLFYLKKTDGQAFWSEKVQKSSLDFNEKDSIFAAIPPFSIYIQSYFTQYLAYVLNLGASSYQNENNLIHKSHCADVGLLVPPQQQ